jgi:sugar phosphate isomerase/epimerase
MNIAVSSYSFSKLQKIGALLEMDIPAKAKEMGFNELEFSALNEYISVPEGVDIFDYAALLRERCDSVGIKVINYAIFADFLNGSNGDWKEEAKRLKQELRIAAILGSSGMRHDLNKWSYIPPKSFEEVLPILSKGCKLVAEYGEELGIKTMAENHGYFCQDSDRMEKLINAVNHSNFGLVVDIGNFICADEEPEKAVGKLAVYASHVHVKDFHVKSGMQSDPGRGWFKSRAGNYLRGTIIGHGCIPVQQCIRVLKDKGYDGSYSIEFEGLEDTIDGINIGRENLARFLSY